VQGETELSRVAAATRASSCFSCSLNGRQQQTNKDTDDGDNNQQFDQRESPVGIQVAGALHENLSKMNGF
jgi:hypothetical protein